MKGKMMLKQKIRCISRIFVNGTSQVRGNVEHNLTGSSSRFSFPDYFVDRDSTLRDIMDGIAPPCCHRVSI